MRAPDDTVSKGMSQRLVFLLIRILTRERLSTARSLHPLQQP